MRLIRQCASVVLAVSLIPALPAGPAEPAAVKQEAGVVQKAPRPGVDGTLLVTVGMSMIIDSKVGVERIFIANGELAEATAIGPKEVLVSGKMAGETSLIVWQQGGSRMVYDLTVRMSPLRLNAVREQIARDFPDEDVNVTFDNDTAFVRGTVKDVIAANRIMSVVSTLGKAVNLLRVEVPAEEPQIMLKVRFADVDRSASQQLGMNIATSAFNQDTGISTGQFGSTGVDNTGTFSLSNALNVLLFRKDINLGVTIEALESKNLLQMLAEPNVLAINGKEASFISGGEFPVPVVQGTSAAGALTIQYKEYGIRLTFLPTITPRGTIRLHVTPEVSALDFAHAVTISGTTVPGTTKRRIDTEVELEEGQSFVIAGLLDNETTEGLSKIPGLSSIPILGKLFQSRSITKSNSELMVIVTPQLVRPIPAGQAVPGLKYPKPFMTTNSGMPMTQPGIDKTGPVPVHPPFPSIPVEVLSQPARMGQSGQPLAAPEGQPGLPPGIGQSPNSTPAGAVKPPGGGQ